MLLLVKFLIKFRLIHLFNFSYKLKLNSRQIIIPIVNGMGKQNVFPSELWMLTVIERLFLIRKGTFVDIGVNVGQTLLKVRAISTDRRYVGFEPNPACVFYVNELIKINSFKNIAIIPAGVSDVDQLITLNYYSEGILDSSASIVADFRNQKVYRKEFVACFGYSSFRKVLDVDPIAIIKIDVEGAELQVLQSLNSVIIEQRPFVIIEILPVYEITNIQRLQRQLKIEELFKQATYKALRINKSSNTFTPLDKLEIDPSIDECDYLFCPEESVQLFLQ